MRGRSTFLAVEILAGEADWLDLAKGYWGGLPEFVGV